MLNAPEAIALMCDAMLEAARAGGSYASVEAAGLAAVAPDEVMPGVRELIDDVRVEVLLGDGTRLIALVDPLGHGEPAAPDGPGAIVPGPAAAAAGDTSAGAGSAVGRELRTITVTNTSRRVVRISSHFPFDQVNPRLKFDRAQAAGFRLDIEAGSSDRWAPGEARAVTLVRFAGSGSSGGTEA